MLWQNACNAEQRLPCRRHSPWRRLLESYNVLMVARTANLQSISIKAPGQQPELLSVDGAQHARGQRRNLHAASQAILLRRGCSSRQGAWCLIAKQHITRQRKARMFPSFVSGSVLLKPTGLL